MYSLNIKSLSVGKKDLDIFYLGVPRAIELWEKEGSRPWLFYGILKDHKEHQVAYPLGENSCPDAHQFVLYLITLKMSTMLGS